LNLLTGGNIHKSLSEVLADVCDCLELGRVAYSVGDSDTHHEVAWGLPAEEHAQPLEPLPVSIGNSLPSFFCVPGKVLKDIQTIFFLLVCLNFVHLASPNQKFVFDVLRDSQTS
jgi:hypothetical protein